MSVIIKNTSTNTLQINDLGDTRKYGIDGYMSQSHQLDPNEQKELATTDEVKNSVLTGDIKKLVDKGDLTILEGTGYTMKQVVIAGAAASTALSLTDVVSVESILAFVTATGAPATKTLLAVTTDYTVASGDITCVTDQSANTLVITYWTL